jgi:hypothetical protein
MAPVLCPKCSFQQVHPPDEAEQMHCESCESVLYIEREDDASSLSFSNPFSVSSGQLATIKARVETENGPIVIGRSIQRNVLWGTLTVIIGSGMTLSGFIGDEILMFPFFGGFALLYVGYKMSIATYMQNFVALEDSHLCLSTGSLSSSYFIPLSIIEDWRIVFNDNSAEGTVKEMNNYQLLIGIKGDYPLTIPFNQSGIASDELQRILDMVNHAE